MGLSQAMEASTTRQGIGHAGSGGSPRQYLITVHKMKS
jgi:hypothetical protein